MKVHVGLRMLRVFCDVCETRSVSKAADRNALSQSAASYLLTQIREQIGDPLFTRSRDGMIATPFATELYHKIKPLLEKLDQALSSVLEFDPSVSNRNFRLAMSDIGEMQFIPELLRATHRDAPNITIETCVLSIEALSDALRTGHIDFVIGYLPELGDKMSSDLLFTEKYVCLYSPENSYLRDGVDLEGYLSSPHVEVVSFHSNHNILDALSETRFADRKIGLRVAHFATVPLTIAHTDMVVTVPARIARSFAKYHQLISSELPFEVPSIEVRMFWCDVFAGDPGHAWMREKIAEALKPL